MLVVHDKIRLMMWFGVYICKPYLSLPLSLRVSSPQWSESVTKGLRNAVWHLSDAIAGSD
ncbi:MAG: hypothetical protein ACM31E_07015 [Fibrobacterota bacterium]|nr:hypothetical protein [Chitinispirillaceae bacterium]